MMGDVVRLFVARLGIFCALHVALVGTALALAGL